MPSLKSSVGRKSTTFQPITPTGIGGDCFLYHQENRFTALHSSWINRLHLRIPPTSTAASVGGAGIHTGDVPHNNLTVSTDDSPITSCSCMPKLSLIAPRYLGPSTRNPQCLRGDGDGRLVAGFGPFQVREARNCAGRNFEKGGFSGDSCFPLIRRGEQEREDREVRFLETKIRDKAIGSRISPLIEQFRPRLGSFGTGAMEKGISRLDPVSSSRLQTSFGPWKVERNLRTPCQVTDSRFRKDYEGKSLLFDPVLASDSSRHPVRSRSAAYHDLSHDASVSRIFQNGHNLNDNVIPQQPEKQVRKKESEEPFSFWNMGRFSRVGFVSSVSSSIDLSLNFSRKRKTNAYDIINSSKFQRTGCDNYRL